MMISKLKTALPLLLVGLFMQSDVRAQAKKPNIVFFLVDDLGWTDVEPFGTSFYETPNIKKLAEESMIFTNAYAACPVCSPTRASILTGKYPVGTGITDFIEAERTQPVKWSRNTPLITPTNKDRLNLDEFTLAEALKTAGYKTFFTGKWHLGPEGFWPENQGFDFNFGGNDLGQPPSYFDPYEPATPTPFYELHRVEPRAAGEFLTDREGDEIVNFLQTQDQKFFIHWAPYAVHTPIMAPESLVEKYKKKESMNQKNPVYAALVENLDQNIGKVIAALERMNLTEKTLVIFTSDNGGLIGNPANPITNNYPLRSQKGYPYEGGIRVPTVVKWPGKVQAGGKSNFPIVTTDWIPTILDYLGLNPREQSLDGMSLTEVLGGVAAKNSRDLFWHFPHYRGTDVVPYSIIRSGDYKLIHYFDEKPDELFSLADDPRELNNLADQFPGLVNQLKASLQAWWTETDARMPKKK